MKIMKLIKNMRLNENDEENLKYSETLLNIGEGRIKSDVEEKILLENSQFNFVKNLKDLINDIYPNIEQNLEKEKWLSERIILSPLNENVKEINNYIMEQIEKNEKIYYSIDTNINDDDATKYPIDFLNKVENPGLPNHILKLKEGTPIMMIRNIRPPLLCNGTRLIIKKMHENIIEAMILNGDYRNQMVVIPKIPLICNNLPFEFKRLQFPIKIAFCLTINKAQGQTIEHVGLDLRNDVFSHGQLYVGLSRSNKIKQTTILNEEGNRIKNIVYKEIL